MTSIDYSVELRGSHTAPDLAARPIWYRQPHSAFLAALVLLNVAADTLVLKSDDTGPLLAAIGFASSQAVLAGVWLALGGLSFPARFTIVAATTAAGGFLAASGEDNALALDLVLVAGAIVLATHAALLPLRSLLGWRIDFDRAYHTVEHRARLQLRLADCLALMAAVALLLACARLVRGEFRGVAVAFGAYAVFGATPIALLTVSRRATPPAWWLAVLTWALLLCAEYLTIDAVGGLNPGELVPFNLGLIAAVALNLGPLRSFFGLRLFSVIPATAGAAAAPEDIRKLNADLALVVAAWADLPEALRREIVAAATSRKYL